MDVFDLVAKLTLDSQSYKQGLEDSEKEAKGFSGKLGTALKVGAAGAAAVTGAVVGISGSLIAGAKDVSDYGDKIDKMSQKMGLSAKSYQEWDYVMGLAGTSMDSMTAGMKTLTNKLDEAKNGSAGAQEMFAKLGLSMDDLQNMSQEDLFSEVIYAFQDMEAGADRAALATDVLGKAGMELAPLFNQSAEATRDQIKAANELGIVMGDDAVAASAQFGDALSTLQQTMGGLKNKLVAEFMPGISDVMDGLTQIFGGDSESGVQMIKEGLSGLIQNITDKIPEFVDLALGILSSLVDTLVENLPQLAEMGIKMIVTLITSLIRKLPDLVKMAPQIIKAIVIGLATAYKEIFTAGIEIVKEIISGIKNLFDGEGGLVEAGKNIINKIKEGIDQLIKDAVNWGRDLVSNFIEGLGKKAEALGTAAKGLAGKVASFLHFSEPDEGPLKDFHTFAPDMVKMYADGITGSIGLVKNAVSKVAEVVKSTLNSSVPEDTWTIDNNKLEAFVAAKSKQAELDTKVVAAETVSNVRSVSSGGGGYSSDAVINLKIDLDGETIAKKTFRYNQAEQLRIGPALVTV